MLEYKNNFLFIAFHGFFLKSFNFFPKNKIQISAAGNQKQYLQVSRENNR